MPADQLKPDSGFDSMKDALEKWKTKQSEENESRKTMKKIAGSFFGVRNLVLLGIGGLVAYQNRFRIQRFLEARGIKTPWLKGSVGEAVKSAGAKVIGSIEHDTGVGQGSRDFDKAAI